VALSAAHAVAGLVPAQGAESQAKKHRHEGGVLGGSGRSWIRGFQSLGNGCLHLITTLAQTQEACQLDEGEYFWFDIIGASVYEEGELIGVVEDIDRMPSTDYLSIKTAQAHTEVGLAKHFLLPYIPRYVCAVDTETKKISVKDAKEILEAS